MLKILKNLDIKSVAIVILSILLIISFTIFIFKRSESMKTINEIKKENKELQENRKSNNKIISKLNNDIKIDSLAIIKLESQIAEINTQLYNNELKTKNDVIILNKFIKQHNNINNQIDNFRKNSKVKTGNHLLSSLKEKTTQK